MKIFNSLVTVFTFKILGVSKELEYKTHKEGEAALKELNKWCYENFEEKPEVINQTRRKTTHNLEIKGDVAE